MRHFSPMHTPSPTTAPASTRVPAPMRAFSPTTAQGPMLTPSPSFTFAPTTAAGCTPVAGSPAFITTMLALLASASAADVASSANTSSASPASSTEFTPLTNRSRSPATSLPPNASISALTFMRLSSIDPRLARRPRLPAAMNPQPLVRIAQNPRLDGAGALLRGSHDVGLFIGGPLKDQLRAEVQHIAPFRLLPHHEPRQNRCAGLQRHARHSRGRAGLFPEKIHEDPLRRSHIRVHQYSHRLALAHGRQQPARKIVLGQHTVAMQAADGVDELVEAPVVQGTNDHAHGMTHQRVIKA